jgi:hypothetical protein
MIPPGPGAEWAGLTAAPVASTSAVEGTEHVQLGNPAVGLRLAEEGVSLVREGYPPGTVLFSGCVGVLAWPDGGRRLVGEDGITVPVEPTLYAPDAGLTAFVDARTPRGTRIDVPARDAEDVPRPPQAETVPGAPARRRTSTARGVLALVGLAVVLLVGLVVLGGGIIDLVVDEDRIIVLDLVLMAVGGFLLGSAGWFARRVILSMTQD